VERINSIAKYLEYWQNYGRKNMPSQTWEEFTGAQANQPGLRRVSFLYKATPEPVSLWRRLRGGMSRTTYLEKEVQRLTMAIQLIECEADSLRENLRITKARHDDLMRDTTQRIQALSKRLDASANKLHS
jgi:hypothetical protein